MPETSSSKATSLTHQLHERVQGTGNFLKDTRIAGKVQWPDTTYRSRSNLLFVFPVRKIVQNLPIRHIFLVHVGLTLFAYIISFPE
jgi:hypothetical protein